MHWADIMAALYKKESSPSKIADDEGISRNFVTEVIRGRKTSHGVAYAIAAATGIPTEKMWPGKYLTPPAYEKARKGNTRGRLPKMKEVSNG